MRSVSHVVAGELAKSVTHEAGIERFDRKIAQSLDLEPGIRRDVGESVPRFGRLAQIQNLSIREK